MIFHAKFPSFYFYAFLLLWIFLAVPPAGGNGQENFYPNVENCGITDEIPGDIRTSHPWTVAIFLRKNPRSPFKYFITGSLSTSTTVLTVFGGGYGHPPYKNRNKRYFIPPPNHYLVVAGLHSTDLKDADRYTQYANVSYLHPYSGNSSGNQDYHLVVFRLTTAIKFNTPYVRPICQPFSILPFLRSVGFEGQFSQIISFREEQSFLGGFNALPGTKGPFPSTWVTSKSSADDLCYNTYKFHYRSLNDEIFCVRVVPGEGVSNSTCLTHGSISVWKSSAYAISFIPALGPPRYHGVGPIGLIPRKDRGQCGVNSTYFIIIIYNAIDWIKYHMICNPRTFPCNDGKCIPLHQVCDGKSECSDGEDEDPVFCTATNRCKNPDDYQCGFEGKCLHLRKVGDGIADCPSGSDEDSRLLSTRRFLPRGSSSSVAQTESCFPLVPSEGVNIDCYTAEDGKVDCSQAKIGSEALLGCAEYYAPIHKTNYIKMKCYDDRKWKPFRSFSCQPECGLLGTEVQGYIAQGEEVKSGTAFPWHAAIFKEKKDFSGSFEYICGASLIERNVLITAAHCTTDPDGHPVDVGLFRVVLNSVSTNLTDNLLSKEAQIFQIAEIFRPWSFNPKTLQSDIAVVRLEKPAQYTKTIKPICYLLKKFNNLPDLNSLGKVPGFGVTESGVISSVLKYVNMQMLPLNECRGMFHDKFCAKSPRSGEGLCHGDSGGGFVFPSENKSYIRTYVLKGVVSDRQRPKSHRCNDTNNVAGFTHVDSHSEWLLTVLESIDTNPDA